MSPCRKVYLYSHRTGSKLRKCLFLASTLMSWVLYKIASPNFPLILLMCGWALHVFLTREGNCCAAFALDKKRGREHDRSMTELKCWSCLDFTRQKKGQNNCFTIVCRAFLSSSKLIGGCFQIAIIPSLSGADTYQLSCNVKLSWFVLWTAELKCRFELTIHVAWTAVWCWHQPASGLHTLH